MNQFHQPASSRIRNARNIQRGDASRKTGSRRAAGRCVGAICALLLVVGSFAHDAHAQPCNLQGTWHLEFIPGSASLTLLDDGSGVLGGVGVLSGLDAEVTSGSYADPDIDLTLTAPGVVVSFSGTMSGCDTASGMVLLGGTPFASGTLARLRSTYCGDGTRQAAAGEQCDDGNFVDGDACTADCTLPHCGDGAVDPFEQCDQGVANAPDGACRNDCSWASCGDGVPFAGPIPPGAPVAVEQCDQGPANSSSANATCRPDCTSRLCGDGVRDDAYGERCDDGNASPGDGCDASCRLESLAHGVEFAITDLSQAIGLPGWINSVTLNDLGQVAGYFGNDGNRAFFWDGATTTVVHPTNPDGESYAFGLNEVGQFVGGRSVPGGVEHAFLASAGSVADIHTIGLSSHAYDINRSGHVVGIVQYGGGVARGFRWDGSAMNDLGTFPGGTFTEGFAINDRGDVALTGNVPPLLESRALLLRDGAWTDLGTLGGPSSNTWALSNAGHVAGDSTRADGTIPRGFLYDGGALIDLGVLGGDRSSARAVNSARQVVGFSTVSPSSTDLHAFVHDCRGINDLNDLVAPNSGYLLDISDWRINDSGQIAGVALHVASGEDRAVLLTPLPFCGNCRVTPSSGEQCDDGNTVNGDGCSATCLLEGAPPVVGTGTVATGAVATPSQPAQAQVTSPSGGTVSIEKTTSGPAATGLEVLGVRFLVEAPAETADAPLVLDFRLDPSLLPPGLAVDDIQILRNGTPVVNCAGPGPHSAALPDPCVSSRASVSGGNVLIRALSSHASEWAFGAEICPTTPDPACSVPIAPRKSTLVMKRGNTSDKDSLVWTWTSGPATTSADFGNPRGAGRITACIYDATGGGAHLREVLVIPPGGTCGKKPCWKATKKGFDYTDRAGSADGVSKLTLLSGGAGKSKVVLRAKGTALPLPELPLAAPVTIQLRTAADQCFGATFATPSPVRDPAQQFKGKSE